jgi:C-terminal processing protease CtpA/Prc
VALLLASAGLAGSMRADAHSRRDTPTRLDEILGIRTAPGAFVMDLAPGSPAERAGLDPCDLIAGFNGRDFKVYGELARFVAALRRAAMSSGAELEVWTSDDSGATYRKDRMSVRIPSRPEVRIGFSAVFQVLVVSVDKDGPAGAAGVEAGEFIHEVDGLEVWDVRVRSIADLDERARTAVDRDGEVGLTLARWRPVRNSTEEKTTFGTRRVTVKIGPARDADDPRAGRPGRVSREPSTGSRLP